MKLNIYTRITIFFIIAVTLSNIFRFDVFSVRVLLSNLPSWLNVICISLLEGSGVFIGALIGIYLLKKERIVTIGLYGTSIKYSILMLLFPILLFTIIGVSNDFNMNQYLYGFVICISSLAYCIMEEYGWRGYLQEELKFVVAWLKYVIIGFMWYIWHLSFLNNLSLSVNLLFLVILIFSSWGIGQVANSTKSIIAAASFHFIVQILAYNNLIKEGLSGKQKIIIVVACIVWWIFIIKIWEKKEKNKGKTTVKEDL